MLFGPPVTLNPRNFSIISVHRNISLLKSSIRVIHTHEQSLLPPWPSLGGPWSKIQEPFKAFMRHLQRSELSLLAQLNLCHLPSRESMTHINILLPGGKNKTVLNYKRKKMSRSWRLYLADNETSSIVAGSWKAHQEQFLTWVQKICNRKLKPEGTVFTSNSQPRTGERTQTKIIE